MKILVIDNYDSFTYNLVHLVKKILNDGSLGGNEDASIDVFRNDKISLEAVEEYDRILLSPGPGLPGEAGLLIPIIQKFAPTRSILGICLGHQAIGEAFGATLTNLEEVYHGVATKIELLGPNFPVTKKMASMEVKEFSKVVSNRHPNHADAPILHHLLFSELPQKILVGRYHSWVVNDVLFPEELEIMARDENGIIMALRHKEYDVQGVQFHPESILTPDGETIIRNWLRN